MRPGRAAALVLAGLAACGGDGRRGARDGEADGATDATGDPDTGGAHDSASPPDDADTAAPGDVGDAGDAGTDAAPDTAVTATDAGTDTAASAADTCGNGALEPGELCDGAAVVAGASCVERGFEGGQALCVNGCRSLDLAGCTTSAVCGDGVIGGPEVCDGLALGREEGGAPLTCASFGASSAGTLACAPGCLRWDLAGCPEDLPGWTCPAPYHGDGDCDCGCGAPDPDCAATAPGAPTGLAACVYCDAPGACTRLAGCGEIDPADPTRCVPAP